ncbi:MAG: LysR family transcriptional regulator [Trueperaceae bacterium]|nr:LysR family transcriptional regulator [Trueperaceae bacterium]
MDFKKLRYFVAVAEEKHFGRAAEKLHLTQPPLSLQIKQLEEDIGVSLLDRTTRRVELTDAGKVFLQRAKQILQATVEAERAAQQTALGMEGRLELGFVSSSVLSILPKALRMFRSRYPDVELELFEMTAAAQSEALLNGQIRLGVVRLPLAMPELQVEELLREPLLIALPEGHELSAQTDITLPMLENRPLIFFTRQLVPGLYAQLLEMFRRINTLPKVSQHAVHLHTITELVASGIGIAIVPTSALRLRSPGVVYRPFAAKNAVTRLGVARLEPPSTLVDNFVVTLRDAVTEYEAEMTNPEAWYNRDA